MEEGRASRLEQHQRADHICLELSFFNVIMAATYFRRAARTNYPDVVHEIGREYLAKAKRVPPVYQS